MSSPLQKIAFVHFGKCAGVYTQSYLRDHVIPHVPLYNSWWSFEKERVGLPRRRYARDWTKEELLEIASKDIESGFAHNHHINWCSETVKAFQDNGWFVFTFLKDPKDMLCSLYFWAKSKRRRGLPSNPSSEGFDSEDTFTNPLRSEIEKMSGQSDPRKVTIDTFINFLVKDEEARKLWVLPDYIDKLDYVAEFNSENFRDFLRVHFDHEYTAIRKRNVSLSKGYEFYYDKGDISEATNKLLVEDHEYLKYGRYLEEKIKVALEKEEELKVFLAPVFNLLCAEDTYCWIGGGCIGGFFLGTYSKDVDVYFSDEDSRVRSRAHALSLGAKVVAKLPQGEKLKFEGKHYDLVRLKGREETPKEWIDARPFTVGKAALCSKGHFYYHPDYYRDLMSKKLVIVPTENPSLNIRGNNKGFLNYLDKGFTIDRENLISYLEYIEKGFLIRKKKKVKNDS